MGCRHCSAHRSRAELAAPIGALHSLDCLFEPLSVYEQTGAVDTNRLGDLTGHLTAEEQWGVGSARLTVLGLN